MCVRIIVCASLIFTGAAAATLSGLNPSDGTLLPPGAAKELLSQCSRAAPQPVAGAWIPTNLQIRELEEQLPIAIASEAQRRGSRYAQAAAFRRQYVGLIIAGRKVVYVNAFPRDVGDPAKDRPAAARKLDWHREPVVVCDGGPAFFGVEYDPDKKAFAHFEFNGPP